MAFCGQCGLLLNTNITKCPRCGATTDFNDAPVNDNAATIITHTNNSQPDKASYTPSHPSLPYNTNDTRKAYYPTPGANEYTEQRPPQSGSDNMISPVATPQQNNQAPGIYPPGVIPTTNPSYPFQQPPRKTHTWLIILIIVLIVALLAVTFMLFKLTSNPFAALFGTHSTPTAQVTPTMQPATPTTQQNTPTTQPSPTLPATTTTISLQQAQATVQQYYADINNHAYQDAYNLWVSNPDNYNHYKQGFAQTQNDAITLGDAIPQTNGTIQVNITVQATENVAGGGTKVSIYQGYYTVEQQTDGSWKIITAYLT